jgi:uncharacterized membrane protein
MSKATTDRSEVKQPRTIAVREFIPWLLVTVLVFSVFGVITGWFLHNNVVQDAAAAVASMSKQ